MFQKISVMISIGCSLLFFGVVASADTMPLPTGQQYFESFPDAEPVSSTDPYSIQPIGLGSVADDGDTLSLKVQLPQFDGPVDVFFGLHASIDPNNVYLLKSDMTFQPISAGLVAWRANTTGPINESLFGNIPDSLLPSGEYDFYLLVAPAGTLTAASAEHERDTLGASRSQGYRHSRGAIFPIAYYLWRAIHSQCPTVINVDQNGTLSYNAEGIPIIDIGQNISFFSTHMSNISITKKLFGQNIVKGSGSGTVSASIVIPNCTTVLEDGTATVTIKGYICPTQPVPMAPPNDAIMWLYYKTTYSATAIAHCLGQTGSSPAVWSTTNLINFLFLQGGLVTDHFEQDGAFWGGITGTQSWDLQLFY